MTFKILFISGNVSELVKSLIYESLYIGCLTALIRWFINIDFKIPDYVALILIGIILILGLLPIDFYKEIHNLFGQSVIALFTSIIILSITTNPEGITSKLLSTPIMAWVGKISYGLYLWHVPIFKIFKYHSTLPPIIYFVLKFALTFLFATLSWMIIEKKSTEFGRKLSKKIIDAN